MNDFVMSQMLKEMARQEQAVFMDIFRQIEGRDPIKEDGKRFTKGYDSRDPLNYHLSFDGTIIGRVVFQRVGNLFSIEFIPL